MKKLFILLSFLIPALAGFSQGYNVVQNLGNSNTLVQVPANGGFRAMLINGTFVDTAAANGSNYKIKYYPFAQIATTSDSSIWFRSANANMWIKFGTSGGGAGGGSWMVGGNLFPVTATPSRNIGTLAPYGGAIGLMTNSVTRLILPDYGLIYSNAATDSFLGRDIDGNLVLKTASGGGGVTDITYSNLVTAISGSTLIPGTTYKITDRGDRGLFFKAVSSNELAKDGTRLMLCPSDYNVETDAHGNVWLGIWASYKSPSVNNLMIWGGKVYKNLTGSIGTATNDTLLDVTNWVAISKSGFTNYEYTEMSFGVNFDITNDWIEKQWDGKGNVITEPYYWSQNYYGRFIGNGCSITDWNLGSEFYNNTAMAVFNNADIYAIYNNICKSNAISNNVSSPSAASPVYIYRNLCVDGIIGNYIGGGIYDNLVYQIARNKVSFDINDNVVTAVIADDTVSSIRANYVSTSILSVYGPSYSVTGSFTNKDITGVIPSNYTELTIENLPSGVGTKQVRYNPSTGNFTYTDTTTGGGGVYGIDDVLAVGQALTDDRSIDVSGNDFEIINANEIYFGNTGLFTISQNAKASVSGTNGTAHVSPLTITGGAGGATSYSVGTVLGGNAGVINITGGNGGNITGTPTTGVGGTGADINLTAGDGGLGTTNGGTAGVVNIAAGTGGQGTAGGAAGYVSIKGGFAGTSTNSDGGHIYLSPGQKQGSGLDGHIFLGISPSGAVRGAATIGSATRGDSLFNIKDGGLYADRGVRFPNLQTGKQASQVYIGADGTLYKGDTTVSSGPLTYTPSLTNTTNIAASTAYTTYYKVEGDWVYVWGEVSIDATAATTITEMNMSLPIPTATFTNSYELAGTGAFEDNTSVQIKADTVAGGAKFRFTPQSASNNTYSFHFSYRWSAP